MRYPLDSFTVTQGFYPVATPQHAFHGGLDLAAPLGTHILSPVAGTVITIGANPNYEGGRYVIVREAGEGREFYMGHCNVIYVRGGQSVSEGQYIADVGQTGNATGPHVHFQIRKRGAGELLNPLDVMNNSAGASMDELNVNRGDINNLTFALWGKAATEDDFKYEGQSFKHVIYNMIGNSQFTERMAQSRLKPEDVSLIFDKVFGRFPDQSELDTYITHEPMALMKNAFVSGEYLVTKLQAVVAELERSRDKDLYPMIEKLKAQVSELQTTQPDSGAVVKLEKFKSALADVMN